MHAPALKQRNALSLLPRLASGDARQGGRALALQQAQCGWCRQAGAGSRHTPMRLKSGSGDVILRACPSCALGALAHGSPPTHPPTCSHAHMLTHSMCHTASNSRLRRGAVAQGKPFFAMVTPTAPHIDNSGRGWAPPYPATRHEGLFPGVRLPCCRRGNIHMRTRLEPATQGAPSTAQHFPQNSSL